ncbi:hypothetical protein [Aestuariivivens insulae]|uniref:hypothetical protein n=1 Tax=Aestuariivivens insulae TaxID=1621988 RepID=UPI001F55D75D|nr:hypothetical protein [Aestuariivivens insulae]
MDNKGYNIIETETDLDILIQDYNDATTPFFKNLKIGVLGTALLCSSPGIYAKESVYTINKEVQETSIDEVYNCGLQIDNLIETANKLKTVRFTKKEVIQNILSFKSLINNWDGYEALPLEVESAGNTIYLLNLLEDDLIGRIDDFYPNPHGTISFEWMNNLNEKVYLEVGNKSFSYFAKFNSSEPLFFDNLEISDENIEVLVQHIRAV